MKRKSKFSRRHNPRDLETEAGFRRDIAAINRLRQNLFSGGGVWGTPKDDAFELNRIARGQHTAAAEVTRYALEGKRPPRSAFVKRMAKAPRRAGRATSKPAMARARAPQGIDWSKAEHTTAPFNWFEDHTWSDDGLKITGRRRNPANGFVIAHILRKGPFKGIPMYARRRAGDGSSRPGYSREGAWATGMALEGARIYPTMMAAMKDLPAAVKALGLPYRVVAMPRGWGEKVGRSGGSSRIRSSRPMGRAR